MTCHGSKGFFFFFTFSANDLNVSLCSFKLIFPRDLERQISPTGCAWDYVIKTFYAFFNIYVMLLILTLLWFNHFTLIWPLWMWIHYYWGKALLWFRLIFIAASWDTLNLTQQSHCYVNLLLIFFFFTSISDVLTGCGCIQRNVASYLCPLCCSAGGRSRLTGPLGRPWAPLPPRTLRWQGGCPCLGRHTPASTHHSPRNPLTFLIQEKQNYLGVV